MFRFVEQDDQMLPGSESIMNRHSSSEPDGTEGSARAADGAGATEPGQAAELATATRRIKELEAALDSSIARERALHFELQHRARNLVSVIRSIYRRSRESDSSEESFAEHFDGRLTAIARYQSHFDGLVAPGFDLEDMVRDELLEARCVDGPSCSLDGPPVTLPQKTAELIGLALHELTTNAIKFGALAHDGRLAIAWQLRREGSARWLDFTWVESGVPVAAAAPRPSGFGRRLIEEALPYQLEASTAFEFRPGGIACSIALPLGAGDPGGSAFDGRPPLQNGNRS